MMYLGGKCRLAKPISNLILEQTTERGTLVSLFCGACAIETKLAPHFDTVICSDAHEYIIALNQAVKDGWEPPENVTESKYTAMRDAVRSGAPHDKALAGFVGFGCSFSGVFFASYAKCRRSDRNFAKQCHDALLRNRNYWGNVTFLCADYRDVQIPDGAVVYCDPPYAGTTKFKGVSFEPDAFWEYMRKISHDHIVFISEQAAPDDFVSIWERTIVRNLKKRVATEHVFVHESVYRKLPLFTEFSDNL